MTGPAASVIIPTYGDWGPITSCLRCLEKQDVAQGTFEIIIANNNAHPDLPAQISLPSNTMLLWEPRPGSYAARNAAIRRSAGAILFFTDADCLPEPDWIAQGLAALTTGAGVDRVGGAIKLFPSGKRWTVPEHHDRLFGLQQDVYVSRGYAATANLIVRRELFEKVGLFDETLFSGGDKEWNGRASRAGHSIIYSEQAIVRHPARASFAAHASKRERVVGGLITLKGGPKPWKVPPPKLLLPPFKRIVRAPGLSATERVRLGMFGYRLRLAELGFRFRLNWGLRKPRRE